MSLKLPQVPNAGLFKQGYQMHSSVDGCIIRNIDAVREISSIISTSMGPCGNKKIVINRLGKTILSGSASTLVNELDVIHPVVKILIMASKQQIFERGDNSNLLIILVGEILNISKKLINKGISVSDLILNYKSIKQFILETLETLVVSKLESINDEEELKRAIKSVIGSKNYDYQNQISSLLSKAICLVINNNSKVFDVDSIRVVKIMGSSLVDSEVVKGMVFPREPVSIVKNIKKPSKVAVFVCPIDISVTETKSTVLFTNADEMLNFTKQEENQLDNLIKKIHDSGVFVVIAGSSIGDLALSYFDKYGILVLKVPSKFDIRRVCLVCNASPLPSLGVPLPDELGSIDFVEIKEIGTDRVTIFKQMQSNTKTATIILRGATKNGLDNIETIIDHGVNAVKELIKDQRLLPGAGATEIELFKRLKNYSTTQSGLSSVIIENFAKAFEIIPEILIQSAGLDSIDVLARLSSAHTLTDKEGLKIGVDIENQKNDGLLDVVKNGIFDIFSTKKSAINLTIDTACSILSIDQLIMAKRAGGPQMPKQMATGVSNENY